MIKQNSLFNMVLFPLYWVTVHIQKIQTVPHSLKINSPSMGRSTKPQLLAQASVDEAFWWLCAALFMVPNVLIKQEFNQQHGEPQRHAFAHEAVPYTHHARPFSPPLLGHMLWGCYILLCFPTCFLPADNMHHAQGSPPTTIRIQA